MNFCGPLGVGGDEHRDGVDEGDAGVDARLGVHLLGVLGADGQVGHEHVGAAGAERLGHVDGLGGRLLAGGLVVLAEPVERRRPQHLDAEVGDRVRSGPCCSGRRRSPWTGPADLGGVDVERGHDLDVADVVAAELDVHEAGDVVGRVGVSVVLEALHEASSRSCRRRRWPALRVLMTGNLRG